MFLGCGGSPPEGLPRVIVLGIDGLDPDMLQERIQRGELPNFQRLVEQGQLHSLGTSWPPQSPVAWSSFITGANPGKHGLYDFIHLDRKNYGLANSMSSIEDVGLELSLFGYKLPLTGGDQVLTRAFPAFWEVLSEAGVPCAVHRMPANFPMRETEALTFPDMGAPDLSGGLSGRPAVYGEAVASERAANHLREKVTVNRYQGTTWRVDAALYGPENTMLDQDDERRAAEEARERGDLATAARIESELAAAREVSTPFTAYVDMHDPGSPRLAVQIDEGEDWAVAGLGEWTDWVPVSFTMIDPLVSVGGWVRFLFQSAEPFQIYATPIQIDPFAPAMPVSTPEEASAELAEAIGPYYTQGFPDAYLAYKNGLLDTPQFVSQSDTVLEERERMLDYALDRYDRDGGLLFFYVGSLDLRCHMLWHCQDPAHPHQEPDVPGFEEEAQIDRVYRQVDALLGRILDEMESKWPEARLVVMSDHGFAPFRREMNVNNWLLEEGYLVLKSPEENEAVRRFLEDGEDAELSIMAPLKGQEPDWEACPVDWERTRALAVGFNGIILNRKGREPRGIVTDAEAESLLEEIRARLLPMTDPKTGEKVFASIRRASEVFAGDQAHLAPDLQLGFNVGYGASDPSAQGQLTRDGILIDNDSRWSGSHLMDPELVQGTLILNLRESLVRDPRLEDLTATLYQWFQVEPPAGLDGRPILPESP